MSQTIRNTGNNDWRISIAPNPVQQLIVIVIVWMFGLGILYGISRLDGQLSPMWYLLVLPFPLVISFYALRGISGANGRMELRSDGFWRTAPSGESLFVYWDQVENFRMGVFGDPIVTDVGVAVPEFEYVDGAGTRTVERLPTNLPLSAEKFVMIMNYAHGEAKKGWPIPPDSYKALCVEATLVMQNDNRGTAPVED